MIGAIADSTHALDAAAELDLDRNDADRKFFAARKKTLAPFLTKLVAAKRALEDMISATAVACRLASR